MKLNDAKVKTAKLSIGKKQLKISDGAGLYLQINQAGKYWRLNYRFAGKQKTLALGVYPSVGLKEARLKTRQAKKLLEGNIDPGQKKKEAKRQLYIDTESNTFGVVADEWLAKNTKRWVTKTLKHKISELNNHILPWLADVRLKDIQALDILSLCQRVENTGHHEQAHRIKMVCSQIMRYGVATGRISTDPTRDLHGALAPVQTKHRPCLKDPKAVGALMRAISEHQGTFKSTLL